MLISSEQGEVQEHASAWWFLHTHTHTHSHLDKKRPRFQWRTRDVWGSKIIKRAGVQGGHQRRYSHDLFIVKRGHVLSTGRTPKRILHHVLSTIGHFRCVFANTVAPGVSQSSLHSSQMFSHLFSTLQNAPSPFLESLLLMTFVHFFRNTLQQGPISIYDVKNTGDLAFLCISCFLYFPVLLHCSWNNFC